MNELGRLHSLLLSDFLHLGCSSPGVLLALLIFSLFPFSFFPCSVYSGVVQLRRPCLFFPLVSRPTEKRAPHPLGIETVVSVTALSDFDLDLARFVSPPSPVVRLALATQQHDTADKEGYQRASLFEE